jgi:aminopeptidase N
MTKRYGFDGEKSNHKSFQLAGAKPHYVPDRPGQVNHIALDLILDLPGQRCQGLCTIQLTPVRDGIQSMDLDAIAMTIQSVKVGRQKQSFDYDGERLTIHLRTPTKAGKSLTLAIDYELDHPQRGLYFVAPDDHYPQKPHQVWTQGEDEDSRYWFPCFDYPGQLATSEIRVQVPPGFMAISNGELIETQKVKAGVIYHWSQPQVHPTYLMTLAVGEFVEIRDAWHQNGHAIPVTYYAEPSRADDAERTMGKTPHMIDYFSRAYGYDYPYPKYAQVCVDDFIFGGMENTSTTLLTDRCLLDERAALDNRSSESLVAHELAHQWFGDLVVIKHWSHAWLKEGMASYSEVMWTEQEYGADEAAYYRLKEARNYLMEDQTRYRRPVVTHVYREAIELYDRHLYEKGACIYHMIRAELGEDLFWKAIHRFVQDNAHRTVETVDLLRAIEAATGRNLLFLFDQYVFRGGHPDFNLSYSWDNDHHIAKVTVKQTQAKTNGNGNNSSNDNGLFSLTVPILFGFVEKHQLKDTQMLKVRVSEAEQSFFIPLSHKPAFISFDHGNHLLKTVELTYSLPELKAQLQFDPDPLARMQAAEALAKKGGLEALNALADALKADPFWGVRAEVAKAVGTIPLDQGLEVLATGLLDSEARVRLAVVEAIAQFHHPESYRHLKPIAEKGDPSYYVEAAAISGLGKLTAKHPEEKPKQSKVLKLLQSVLKERAGWNEVVRSGAIAALSHLKTSEQALELVVKYTVLGTPQPLRLAAIRALGAFGPEATIQNRVLDRLEALMAETFFLTQVAVVIALGKVEHRRAIALLGQISAQTADGRVRRMADEALQGLRGKLGANKTVEGLQEELTQLQRTHQELRSRLEALEAQAKPKESAKK